MFTIILRISDCKNKISIAIYINTQYIPTTLLYYGNAYLYKYLDSIEYIISYNSIISVSYVEDVECSNFGNILIKTGYAIQKSHGLIISPKGLLELI